MDANLIMTDFEINEQVFVPAGDGEPACWMRKGDLYLAAFKRWAAFDEAQDRQHLARFNRTLVLIDEAKRRMAGRLDLTLDGVLTEEELEELTALHLTTSAFQRQFDKRQAAIDQDKAAGRFCGRKL